MSSNLELNNIQNLEQIVKFIEIGCIPEVSTNENQLAKQLKIKPLDILHSCIYLCGEHCQSDFQWSNTENHRLMNLCIVKLCSLLHYSNIDELFAHVNISKMFAGLLHKLENENWKKYPAAVECFMWILKYLKMPRLNNILHLVMPLPLNIFDNYQDSNRLLALDAFQHIIDNTPAAELAMSGYDIVLLKSLESGLQSFPCELIPNLLRCILSLISKMQMKHLTKKNSIEWTEFDNVMNILLPRMEMDHKTEAIECFASIWPIVLESVGFACIRWSKRLIPLFAEYIMQEHATLATVKAIEVFITQTWPKSNTYWNVLLAILIKALYNEDKTQPKKENILAIEECIKTLKASRPECINPILTKFKECKEFQSKKIFKESLKKL
ncbi:Armadillo-type fold,Tti2 family,Armadillo-like helical [Cinara cedri]|uniref:Armadillo-type fold,Tti2 family,Armadillo-like helical n=1 Tax=Cinara cedri TaxID=506608 RepID=A0A5E4MXM6_9HEMI|nr:Armadillo-type fold,Tti2 family,Armadillo-like helical [Cinara cedri]